MIRAALASAAEKGAPAVKGYARSDGKRVHDGSAHMCTESMFRRAGFRRIRGVIPDLPRSFYTPRITVRATVAPAKKRSARGLVPVA